MSCSINGKGTAAGMERLQLGARPMDDLTSALACLAAIGLTCCAVAIASVQPIPARAFDHPRPQVELRHVELRLATAKSRKAQAIQYEHKSKQPDIHVAQRSRPTLRLSKEAYAHGEVTQPGTWSLLNIH
jgi:hypothetical protein